MGSFYLDKRHAATNNRRYFPQRYYHWLVLSHNFGCVAALVLIPGGPTCIMQTGHLSYTFFIPSVVFEGSLCVLALYKLLSIRKSIGAYREDCIQIVDPLLLDTFIYFTRYVIFHHIPSDWFLQLYHSVEGIYLTCLVIWKFFPVSQESLYFLINLKLRWFLRKLLLDLPIQLVAVLPSVIANRMVLRIRGSKWTNSQRTLSLPENVTYATTSPSFNFGPGEETYL